MLNTSSHPTSILIVEDEIFVALDIERVLSDCGYEVGGIAMDRDEALRLAEGCTLALVDINLRDGRTGPQIAAELYDSHAIRSVFVTANPAQIGTPPMGALGYVCKPFDRLSNGRCPMVIARRTMMLSCRSNGPFDALHG